MDKPFVLVDERKWGGFVPRQVYTQVVWERDVALNQLADIGKGLGEKMDDVERREEGEWEFFVETSFNGEVTEVDNCGWRCSHCKKPLEEVVGGYWDDETKMPTLNFCPNCGAKMDEASE